MPCAARRGGAAVAILARRDRPKATLNKSILALFSGRKREPSSRLLSPNQSLA
jgi:hypothetical protein